MTRFERFAWAFLAYLFAVILFGAWVRISGSGAGCGNHWPLCQGDVVPVAPSAKTIIEFSHRLTSGLSGLFGLALVVWAWRLAYARGSEPSRDRKGAVYNSSESALDRRVFPTSLVMLALLLLEGFIGAVLVKKELVAGDASTSRAIVVALHLCNTLLLTASAAAMAWWAGERRRANIATSSGLAPSKAILAAMIVLLIATNATGAVTALGDTLFPMQPALDGGLLANVREQLSPAHHFLVRLRIVHPLVAMLSVVLVGGALLRLMQLSKLRLLKSSLHAVAGQAALGFLNIALGAPAWMQILHLLAAQVVWVLVFLSVTELWETPGALPPESGA